MTRVENFRFNAWLPKEQRRHLESRYLQEAAAVVDLSSARVELVVLNNKEEDHLKTVVLAKHHARLARVDRVE